MTGHLREIVRHRALLACLVGREVRARYRGSVLGFLWTFANPVLLLAVYLLVFERFTGAVSMDRYALFLFAGILPWLAISASLVAGSTSLIHGAQMVTGACLPPWIPPTVVALSNVANLAFALPLALAVAVWHGVPPGTACAATVVAMVPLVLFLHGATLAAASLTVVLRDVQHLVQNLLFVAFFLTPVAYPASSVPAPWRTLLVANPAAALVVPFQRAIHGGAFATPAETAAAVGWGVAACVAGVGVFTALRWRMVESL